MKRPVLFESTFTNLLVELEPRFQELYEERKTSSDTPAVAVFDTIVKNVHSMEGSLLRIKNEYSRHNISRECIEKLSVAMLLTLEKLLKSRWNSTMRDTWAIFISTVLLLSCNAKTEKENDKVHQLR